MKFLQTSSVLQLYFADQNPPGIVIGFLLPSDQNPPFNKPITLGDAWDTFKTGTYLLLGRQPSSQNYADFARNAWALLNGANGILWVADPDASPLTGLLLSLNGRTEVASELNFAYGPQGGSILLKIGANCLVNSFDGRNVQIITTAASIIQLTPQTGTSPFSISRINFAIDGPLGGTLQFAITASSSLSDLDRLDVGLRTFQAGSGGSITSLRYPVFVPPPLLDLYANFDPLTTAGERTFFAFNAGDAGQPPSAPVTLGCYYRSIDGEPYHLTPQSGSTAPSAFARLVLMANPHNTGGGSTPFYLSPMGDFQLQLPSTDPTAKGVRLMCGFSGAEYLILNPQAANQLSFFTDATGAIVPGPTLSMVSAGAAVKLSYAAQPDSSVWYGQAASNGTSGNFSYLTYLEVPACYPAATIEPASAYPMFPYAGLNGSNLAEYETLEQETFSPARHRLILANAAFPSSTGTGSVAAATEAGLVAGFAQDLGEIAQIVLAQANPPATDVQLSAIPAGSDLWNALFANHLFLVISEPSAIEKYLTAYAIEMDSWQFSLNPSTWDDEGTILILKYTPTPLATLAADVSTWTSGPQFNSNVQQTSAALRELIKDASSNPDPSFNEVVNGEWEGVIVFNASISSTPAQLQGIYASIPTNALKAHHIGLNASSVLVNNGVPSPNHSSLFGLIHYEADPMQDNGADYQFQVQSIQVVFANSVVAQFSSTVLLKANVLFGDETLPPAGQSLSVVALSGVMQTQTLPDGSVVETYQFQTPEGVTTIIPMKSNVLDAVSITKAQLITESNTGSVVETKFVFWGMLDFTAQPNFDVFSFGSSSAATRGAGLSFSNLAVYMTFTTGQNPTSDFVFDASQVALDLASSSTRDLSFFEHFPLTLAGFTQGKSGVTPQSLGYMGIQSPLSQSSPTYPWYSINFNLNLGTVGALAGEAGFVASLIAAWSPNSGSPQIYVGLKLPGSNGGKREIDLEGVLHITFKTLELIVQTKDNPPATSYILAINGIALNVFSLSLPPAGQLNLALLGDPYAGAGENATLAWYGAYAKPGTQPPPKDSATEGIAG